MRSAWLALASLAVLSACGGRPLTEAEVAFLAPLHGDTLDVDAVRITATPAVSIFPITYDARPRVTCRERIGPPLTGRITARTGGIVVFQRLFAAPVIAPPDFVAGEPLDLALAMFFAHEMTHVWQWQNRALTGYHPLKALGEQVFTDDPYLFVSEDAAPFLARGYEEQASLVEEYLCCATLDSDGERTARLFDLLSPVLPVAPPDAFPRIVTVPWAADLPGICA
ncbi:hypothetical protein [Jannaschia sp. LMIT008]|uniref:hypothetical protein n=1 Tax=Jannaschia maritima TaxID=3032585 RepID=UPI0028124FDF|nr:hypothetical protein [Jannaschia sp. LMIT008]